jgi:hypothetical protein
MALQVVPSWVSTPNSLTVTTILVLLFSLIVTAFVKRRNFVNRVNKVPGSKSGGLTVLGDSINVITKVYYFLRLECCIAVFIAKTILIQLLSFEATFKV